MAKVRKSSAVRPVILGTAEIFTAFLATNWRSKGYVYIKYLIQPSIKYRRFSSVDMIVLLSTT